MLGPDGPGTMQASYDSCPTGNEADLSGGTNPVTTVGMGNPLRQGSVPYDDGTKDYVSSSGVILEDYTGTGTQTPGRMYGDAVGDGRRALGGQHLGGGTISFARLYESSNENCDDPNASEDCSVSQDTSGESSASAGGGAQGNNLPQIYVNGQPYPRDPSSGLHEGTLAPSQSNSEAFDPETAPLPPGATLRMKLAFWAAGLARILDNIKSALPGGG